MSVYYNTLRQLGFQDCTPRKNGKGRISNFSSISRQLFKAHYDGYHPRMSRQLATALKRYINTRPKYEKRTPEFVDEIRRKILCLHEYNVKIAEVKTKYPKSEQFDTVLMQYVELECGLMYDTYKEVDEDHENNVTQRVLRLLRLILHDALHNNNVPLKTTIQACDKALLKFFANVRADYISENKLVANTMVKLLHNLNLLDDVNQLKGKNISFQEDTFLRDPRVCTIRQTLATSDYESDLDDDDDDLISALDGVNNTHTSQNCDDFRFKFGFSENNFTSSDLIQEVQKQLPDSSYTSRQKSRENNIHYQNSEFNNSLNERPIEQYFPEIFKRPDHNHVKNDNNVDFFTMSTANSEARSDDVGNNAYICDNTPFFKRPNVSSETNQAKSVPSIFLTENRKSRETQKTGLSQNSEIEGFWRELNNTSLSNKVKSNSLGSPKHLLKGANCRSRKFRDGQSTESLVEPMDTINLTDSSQKSLQEKILPEEPEVIEILEDPPQLDTATYDTIRKSIKSEVIEVVNDVRDTFSERIPTSTDNFTVDLDSFPDNFSSSAAEPQVNGGIITIDLLDDDDDMDTTSNAIEGYSESLNSSLNLLESGEIKQEGNEENRSPNFPVPNSDDEQNFFNSDKSSRNSNSSGVNRAEKNPSKDSAKEADASILISDSEDELPDDASERDDDVLDNTPKDYIREFKTEQVCENESHTSVLHELQADDGKNQEQEGGENEEPHGRDKTKEQENQAGNVEQDLEKSGEVEEIEERNEEQEEEEASNVIDSSFQLIEKQNQERELKQQNTVETDVLVEVNENVSVGNENTIASTYSDSDQLQSNLHFEQLGSEVTLETEFHSLVEIEVISSDALEKHSQHVATIVQEDSTNLIAISEPAIETQLDSGEESMPQPNDTLEINNENFISNTLNTHPEKQETEFIEAADVITEEIVDLETIELATGSTKEIVPRVEAESQTPIESSDDERRETIEYQAIEPITASESESLHGENLTNEAALIDAPINDEETENGEFQANIRTENIHEAEISSSEIINIDKIPNAIYHLAPSNEREEYNETIIQEMETVVCDPADCIDSENDQLKQSSGSLCNETTMTIQEIETDVVADNEQDEQTIESQSRETIVDQKLEETETEVDEPVECTVSENDQFEQSYESETIATRQLQEIETDVGELVGYIVADNDQAEKRIGSASNEIVANPKFEGTETEIFEPVECIVSENIQFEQSNKNETVATLILQEEVCEPVKSIVSEDDQQNIESVEVDISESTHFSKQQNVETVQKDSFSVFESTDEVPSEDSLQKKMLIETTADTSVTPYIQQEDNSTPVVEENVEPVEEFEAVKNSRSDQRILSETERLEVAHKQQLEELEQDLEEETTMSEFPIPVLKDLAPSSNICPDHVIEEQKAVASEVYHENIDACQAIDYSITGHYPTPLEENSVTYLSEAQDTGSQFAEIPDNLPAYSIDEHLQSVVSSQSNVQDVVPSLIPEVDASRKVQDETLLIPEVDVSGKPQDETLLIPEVDVSGKVQDEALLIPEVDVSDKVQDEALLIPEVDVSERVQDETLLIPEVDVTEKVQDEALLIPEVDVSGKVQNEALLIPKVHVSNLQDGTPTIPEPLSLCSLPCAVTEEYAAYDAEKKEDGNLELLANTAVREFLALKTDNEKQVVDTFSDVDTTSPTLNTAQSTPRKRKSKMKFDPKKTCLTRKPLPRSVKQPQRQKFVKSNVDETENKRVTRNMGVKSIHDSELSTKSQKLSKTSRNDDLKYRPHDFISMENSILPPRTNNVYAQKRLIEPNTTSEESNDSCESTLVIDFGETLRQSKKIKSVYEEDTICDMLEFVSTEDKVTVCISIPESEASAVSDSFHILRQMENFVDNNNQKVNPKVIEDIKEKDELLTKSVQEVELQTESDENNAVANALFDSLRSQETKLPKGINHSIENILNKNLSNVEFIVTVPSISNTESQNDASKISNVEKEIFNETLSIDTEKLNVATSEIQEVSVVCDSNDLDPTKLVEFSFEDKMASENVVVATWIADNPVAVLVVSDQEHIQPENSTMPEISISAPKLDDNSEKAFKTKAAMKAYEDRLHPNPYVLLHNLHSKQFTSQTESGIRTRLRSRSSEQTPQVTPSDRNRSSSVDLNSLSISVDSSHNTSTGSSGLDELREPIDELSDKSQNQNNDSELDKSGDSDERVEAVKSKQDATESSSESPESSDGKKHLLSQLEIPIDDSVPSQSIVDEAIQMEEYGCEVGNENVNEVENIQEFDDGAKPNIVAQDNVTDLSLVQQIFKDQDMLIVTNGSVSEVTVSSSPLEDLGEKRERMQTTNESPQKDAILMKAKGSKRRIKKSSLEMISKPSKTSDEAKGRFLENTIKKMKEKIEEEAKKETVSLQTLQKIGITSDASVKLPEKDVLQPSDKKQQYKESVCEDTKQTDTEGSKIRRSRSPCKATNLGKKSEHEVNKEKGRSQSFDKRNKHHSDNESDRKRRGYSKSLDGKDKSKRHHSDNEIERKRPSQSKTLDDKGKINAQDEGPNGHKKEGSRSPSKSKSSKERNKSSSSERSSRHKSSESKEKSSQDDKKDNHKKRKRSPSISKSNKKDTPKNKDDLKVENKAKSKPDENSSEVVEKAEQKPSKTRSQKQPKPLEKIDLQNGIVEDQFDDQPVESQRDESQRSAKIIDVIEKPNEKDKHRSAYKTRSQERSRESQSKSVQDVKPKDGRSKDKSRRSHSKENTKLEGEPRLDKRQKSSKEKPKDEKKNDCPADQEVEKRKDKVKENAAVDGRTRDRSLEKKDLDKREKKMKEVEKTPVNDDKVEETDKIAIGDGVENDRSHQKKELKERENKVKEIEKTPVKDDKKVKEENTPATGVVRKTDRSQAKKELDKRETKVKEIEKTPVNNDKVKEDSAIVTADGRSNDHSQPKKELKKRATKVKEVEKTPVKDHKVKEIEQTPVTDHKVKEIEQTPVNDDEVKEDSAIATGDGRSNDHSQPKKELEKRATKVKEIEKTPVKDHKVKEIEKTPVKDDKVKEDSAIVTGDGRSNDHSQPKKELKKRATKVKEIEKTLVKDHKVKDIEQTPVTDHKVKEIEQTPVNDDQVKEDSAIATGDRRSNDHSQPKKELEKRATKIKEIEKTPVKDHKVKAIEKTPVKDDKVKEDTAIVTGDGRSNDHSQPKKELERRATKVKEIEKTPVKDHKMKEIEKTPVEDDKVKEIEKTPVKDDKVKEDSTIATGNGKKSDRSQAKKEIEKTPVKDDKVKEDSPIVTGDGRKNDHSQPKKELGKRETKVKEIEKTPVKDDKVKEDSTIATGDGKKNDRSQPKKEFEKQESKVKEIEKTPVKEDKVKEDSTIATGDGKKNEHSQPKKKLEKRENKVKEIEKTPVKYDKVHKDSAFATGDGRKNDHLQAKKELKKRENKVKEIEQAPAKDDKVNDRAHEKTELENQDNKGKEIEKNVVNDDKVKDSDKVATGSGRKNDRSQDRNELEKLENKIKEIEKAPVREDKVKENYNIVTEDGKKKDRSQEKKELEKPQNKINEIGKVLVTDDKVKKGDKITAGDGKKKDRAQEKKEPGNNMKEIEKTPVRENVKETDTIVTGGGKENDYSQGKKELEKRENQTKDIEKTVVKSDKLQADKITVKDGRKNDRSQEKKDVDKRETKIKEIMKTQVKDDILKESTSRDGKENDCTQEKKELEKQENKIKEIENIPVRDDKVKEIETIVTGDGRRNDRSQEKKELQKLENKIEEIAKTSVKDNKEKEGDKITTGDEKKRGRSQEKKELEKREDKIKEIETRTVRDDKVMVNETIATGDGKKNNRSQEKQELTKWDSKIKEIGKSPVRDDKQKIHISEKSKPQIEEIDTLDEDANKNKQNFAADSDVSPSPKDEPKICKLEVPKKRKYDLHLDIGYCLDQTKTWSDDPVAKIAKIDQPAVKTNTSLVEATKESSATVFPIPAVAEINETVTGNNFVEISKEQAAKAMEGSATTKPIPRVVEDKSAFLEIKNNFVGSTADIAFENFSSGITLDSVTLESKGEDKDTSVAPKNESVKNVPTIPTISEVTIALATNISNPPEMLTSPETPVYVSEPSIVKMETKNKTDYIAPVKLLLPNELDRITSTAPVFTVFSSSQNLDVDVLTTPIVSTVKLPGQADLSLIPNMSTSVADCTTTVSITCGVTTPMTLDTVSSNTDQEKTCLFPFNEEGVNRENISTSEIFHTPLGIDDISPTKLPLASNQSLDFIASSTSMAEISNSMSLVHTLETSAINFGPNKRNFGSNFVPRVTEISCFVEKESTADHNYTLGDPDPLLGGNHEDRNNILTTGLSLDNSPEDFQSHLEDHLFNDNNFIEENGALEELDLFLPCKKEKADFESDDVIPKPEDIRNSLKRLDMLVDISQNSQQKSISVDNTMDHTNNADCSLSFGVDYAVEKLLFLRDGEVTSQNSFASIEDIDNIIETSDPSIEQAKRLDIVSVDDCRDDSSSSIPVCSGYSSCVSSNNQKVVVEPIEQYSITSVDQLKKGYSSTMCESIGKSIPNVSKSQDQLQKEYISTVCKSIGKSIPSVGQSQKDHSSAGSKSVGKSRANVPTSVDQLQKDNSSTGSTGKSIPNVCTLTKPRYRFTELLESVKKDSSKNSRPKDELENCIKRKNNRTRFLPPKMQTVTRQRHTRSPSEYKKTEVLSFETNTIKSHTPSEPGRIRVKTNLINITEPNTQLSQSLEYINEHDQNIASEVVLPFGKPSPGNQNDIQEKKIEVVAAKRARFDEKGNDYIMENIIKNHNNSHKTPTQDAKLPDKMKKIDVVDANKKRKLNPNDNERQSEKRPRTSDNVLDKNRNPSAAKPSDIPPPKDRCEELFDELVGRDNVTKSDELLDKTVRESTMKAVHETAVKTVRESTIKAPHETAVKTVRENTVKTVRGSTVNKVLAQKVNEQDNKKVTSVVNTNINLDPRGHSAGSDLHKTARHHALPSASTHVYDSTARFKSYQKRPGYYTSGNNIQVDRRDPKKRLISGSIVNNPPKSHVKNFGNSYNSSDPCTTRDYKARDRMSTEQPESLFPNSIQPEKMNREQFAWIAEIAPVLEERK